MVKNQFFKGDLLWHIYMPQIDPFRRQTPYREKMPINVSKLRLKIWGLKFKSLGDLNHNLLHEQ